MWSGGWLSLADGTAVPRHGVAYDPASNRWAALPPSPLRGRTEAVCVWTGTDMLIWGGIGVNPSVSYADAAAFRPATG